jgi:Skp family chaperone for outer membrane proteins
MLKQQQMMEDKEWLEGLYQEALKATETIAKEKGLDLVLERTEPKFPMASEEVFSVISTHKVLYCGACVDLTSEVLTRVDASTGIKP